MSRCAPAGRADSMSAQLSTASSSSSLYKQSLSRTAVTEITNYIADWHSEECKLTLTLTFDLLTSNEIGNQDLRCTIHLPSLLMICPVVFVLERTHTLHTYPHGRTEPINALLTSVTTSTSVITITSYHPTLLPPAMLPPPCLPSRLCPCATSNTKLIMSKKRPTTDNHNPRYIAKCRTESKDWRVEPIP